MRYCKICGKAFSYHVPCSHLEEHNITRKEYDEIPIKDCTFTIPKKKYGNEEKVVLLYTSDVISKNNKKYRKGRGSSAIYDT